MEKSRIFNNNKTEIDYSTKKKIRQEVFNYLGTFGKNIRTKLTNICGKTGQYNIPDELYQKRTSRTNRTSIPWHSVKENNFTMKYLESFEGGVAVEFQNNDYFDIKNKENRLFKTLCEKIGSDENVSAYISIRSENGSSSSSIQREAFSKLTNNCEIIYKKQKIVLTRDNYQGYAIRQDITGKGKGNETWSNFLFVSIKGGQQDTIETHRGQELTLFNPACEYASREVCLDIDLVASYFMMMSIDVKNLNKKQRITHKKLIKKIENYLFQSEYESPAYTGNLLDYCKNHYCLSLYKGQLTDPIQLKKITIENFSKKERENESVDFTHNEAVLLDKYYWDSKKNCILSPARPSNIFWSLHLSNMMQQDFTLNEYYEEEEKRFSTRKKLIEENERINNLKTPEI